MSIDLKGNLNPYLGRIESSKIAENFAKNHQTNENEELKKAAQSFEALFVQILLKSMRKTVPKSTLSQSGLDYDIYMSMFDEQISKKIAERNTIGLSKLIYNEVEKKLHKENSIPIKRNVTPMKLKPEKKPIPLNNEQTIKGLNNIDSLLNKINEYDDIIEKAAEKYDLEPSLIKAVIAKESSGNHKAVSDSGAKGLMQLKDETAKEVGVSKIFNPIENIFGGTAYLKRMIEEHNGDLKLALASYNAGPGTVRKYGGIPPFAETKNYVKKVLNYFELFRRKDNELKST